MKIAGVVVFYNPDNNIMDNINTYLPKLDKLYVVDNSIHKDNSKLLSNSKKIIYINNQDNLGIAKALNIGCERAIKDKYSWILTMDQDSKFTGDNLNKLIDYVLNNDCQNIGIVTPYHLIETNIPRPKEKIDHPIEVMTSGNLLNLNIYQKVGGFKDWLFIDDVDIEYCMNIKSKGYDIVRLDDVELQHHLGNYKEYHILGHRVLTSNHNYIRRYYMTRNSYYIYDMYHKYFPEHCDYIRGGIKFQARNILFLEKDKYRKLRNMLRGKRD